jgi:hypothetical protein
MKKAPAKYGLGIGLLLVGIVFVAINWYLFHYQNQYMPKLLVSGTVIFFLGLGFTIFPGAEIDETNSRSYLKNKLKETSWLIKLIWILFLLAGVLATVMIMDHYHLNLV